MLQSLPVLAHHFLYWTSLPVLAHLFLYWHTTSCIGTHTTHSVVEYTCAGHSFSQVLCIHIKQFTYLSRVSSSVKAFLPSYSVGGETCADQWEPAHQWADTGVLPVQRLLSNGCCAANRWVTTSPAVCTVQALKLVFFPGFFGPKMYTLEALTIYFCFCIVILVLCVL